MRVQTKELKAWGGSIVFHLGLLLVMILWNVHVPVAAPEFIEVSWGTVAAASRTAAPARTGVVASGYHAGQPASAGTLADLPERRLNVSDEALPVPATKKLEITEDDRALGAESAERLVGTKERLKGTGSDRRGEVPQTESGILGGGASEPADRGMEGSTTGSSVSMSLFWSAGGTRKKLSGDLPSYPPGVNVEAQIKVEAVVTPAGMVKSIKPYQKANTRLEDAAIDEVRLWRFEPLRASSPQIDQTCLITFNFRLR